MPGAGHGDFRFASVRYGTEKPVPSTNGTAQAGHFPYAITH